MPAAGVSSYDGEKPPDTPESPEGTKGRIRSDDTHTLNAPQLL